MGKELWSRVFFPRFFDDEFLINLLFFHVLFVFFPKKRSQETDTSAIETQHGCFPEFHEIIPQPFWFDPTFFPPVFVASWSFLEFPRPGSLKAIAQVLFAPEQAKQAMAERKTEVFGQFATLHPEARVQKGEEVEEILGLVENASYFLSEKRWALERGRRWENETYETFVSHCHRWNEVVMDFWVLKSDGVVF